MRGHVLDAYVRSTANRDRVVANGDRIPLTAVIATFTPRILVGEVAVDREMRNLDIFYPSRRNPFTIFVLHDVRVADHQDGRVRRICKAQNRFRPPGTSQFHMTSIDENHR